MPAMGGGLHPLAIHWQTWRDYVECALAQIGGCVVVVFGQSQCWTLA
jgi:hypothetical protein